MFCQKCGKENEDSASLCTQCGATLSKEETPGAKKASASNFWKRFGIGCAAIVAIAIVGLGLAYSVSKSRLNDNSPDHMEYARANYYYEKGSTPSTGADGLSPYIVLADSSGEMTTSDGTATITIVEEAFPTGVVVYSQVVEVKKSDFRKRMVPGDFMFDSHDLIVCEFAPVKDSSLTRVPSGTSHCEMTIEFTTPDGRVLVGKSQVWFD
jgi:hypothetical protein